MNTGYGPALGPGLAAAVPLARQRLRRQTEQRRTCPPSARRRTRQASIWRLTAGVAGSSAVGRRRASDAFPITNCAERAGKDREAAQSGPTRYVADSSQGRAFGALTLTLGPSRLPGVLGIDGLAPLSAVPGTEDYRLGEVVSSPPGCVA